MRRNPATLRRGLSIPVVVMLVLGGACSSPNRQVASTAPAAEAPAEPEKTAPPKPAPAAAATNPTPTENTPTPAETPVQPPLPEPAATEAKPTPTETEPDALKWLQAQEQKRAEYEQNLAKLAADRDAAKAALAKNERDLLAFRNPYLARPNLAPAEAGEVQGMNGADRVKWAEGRVADAIASLDAAQKAYDDAKANPPE